MIPRSDMEPSVRVTEHIDKRCSARCTSFFERLRRCGSRRHLRGRTALQADTEGWHTVRGRCPRLLTVQPSRLDSLACPGLCARCAFSPFAARAAIFAGVQPSRLILRVFPAVRGRCPRLLTVQPSRLDSLACLIILLRHEVQRSHTCWCCHLCSKSILAWKAIP